MLAERCDELAEENRQLREILKPPMPLPAEWKLTGSEATLFRHLATRQLATSESAYVALYGFDGERDPKIVDVFICKMRAKLSRFGVSIKTLWGEGYQLEDRRRWRALLERQEGKNDMAFKPQETIQISFTVTPKVFAGLEARAAGVKPALYAKQLFEAGYAARVGHERGERSADAELDRWVRQVFLMADCEAEFIASALDMPPDRVERILAAWRQVAKEAA